MTTVNRYYLFFIFLCSAPLSLQCQSKEGNETKNEAGINNEVIQPAKFSLFLNHGEIWGGYSINIDYLIYYHDKFFLSTRTGFSLEKYRIGKDSYGFGTKSPLSVYFNKVIYKNHFIEAGAGTTIFIKSNSIKPYVITPTFSYFPSIGYRFQKKKGGLFGRITYKPNFSKVIEWRRFDFYGVSLGWTFGKTD